MADLTLRCPGCDARLRLPAGKKAARCPRCSATIRVPDGGPDEPETEAPARAVRPSRRREDEEREDDRPRARRPRDEDEEDDTPRRRQAQEEDEEDDRARRRPRPSEPTEGPWGIAAGVAAGCFLLSLLLAFVIYGSAGMPPGQDGPAGKMIGLGIGLVVSLVLMPLGTIAVKQRRAYGRFGFVVEGTWGVITGFIQACMGGLVGGFSLYGLALTLINGR